MDTNTLYLDLDYEIFSEFGSGSEPLQAVTGTMYKGECILMRVPILESVRWGIFILENVCWRLYNVYFKFL